MQIHVVIKTCQDRSTGAALPSKPLPLIEHSSKLSWEGSKQLSERSATKGFGCVALSVELRSNRRQEARQGGLDIVSMRQNNSPLASSTLSMPYFHVVFKILR